MAWTSCVYLSSDQQVKKRRVIDGKESKERGMGRRGRSKKEGEWYILNLKTFFKRILNDEAEV